MGITRQAMVGEVVVGREEETVTRTGTKGDRGQGTGNRDRDINDLAVSPGASFIYFVHLLLK